MCVCREMCSMAHLLLPTAVLMQVLLSQKVKWPPNGLQRTIQRSVDLCEGGQGVYIGTLASVGMQGGTTGMASQVSCSIVAADPDVYYEIPCCCVGLPIAMGTTLKTREHTHWHHHRNRVRATLATPILTTLSEMKYTMNNHQHISHRERVHHMCKQHPAHTHLRGKMRAHQRHHQSVHKKMCIATRVLCCFQRVRLPKGLWKGKIRSYRYDSQLLVCLQH
jgi:hypothetical protein